MYEARDRTIVRPAADYAESGTPGDLPGGDDDQDGTTNAHDCAPNDDGAWQYLIGYPDVDTDGDFE